MDQTGGVRVLLERMGLDPDVRAYVKEIERRTDYKRLINDPPEWGRQAVKDLLHYGDGQMLINCIFAFIIADYHAARSSPSEAEPAQPAA